MIKLERRGSSLVSRSHRISHDIEGLHHTAVDAIHLFNLRSKLLRLVVDFFDGGHLA